MLLLQICTCIFSLLPTGKTFQAEIVNHPKILCPILGSPNSLHSDRGTQVESDENYKFLCLNDVRKRYDMSFPHMLNEWDAIKDKLLSPFVFLELSLYPHGLHFILPGMSLEPWVKYFFKFKKNCTNSSLTTKAINLYRSQNRSMTVLVIDIYTLQYFSSSPCYSACQGQDRILCSRSLIDCLKIKC